MTLRPTRLVVPCCKRERTLPLYKARRQHREAMTLAMQCLQAQQQQLAQVMREAAMPPLLRDLQPQAERVH